VHLRESEFQLEEEIRLRVCWKRLAKKTEEASSKEIDLPFLGICIGRASDLRGSRRG